MNRADIDKEIDELMKKCKKSLGGYACDKQSAYSNGFMDGLREALVFTKNKTVEDDNKEFVCDICGCQITDFESDLFHHSGILHGRINTHIHLCAKCNNEIVLHFINFDDKIHKA